MSIQVSLGWILGIVVFGFDRIEGNVEVSGWIEGIVFCAGEFDWINGIVICAGEFGLDIRNYSLYADEFDWIEGIVVKESLAGWRE